MKQDSAKQAQRIDAACSASGSVTQCMALAATANTTAMNLLTTGMVYADSPEKQQLISELVTQQVSDMDRLYAARWTNKVPLRA